MPSVWCVIKYAVVYCLENFSIKLIEVLRTAIKGYKMKIQHH